MKKARTEPARDWENPSVISRNKRRAHVPLRSFPDQESALKYFTENSGDRLDQARIKHLSQRNWKFHLAGKPEDVPSNFSSGDFDDSAWAQVRTLRAASFSSSGLLLLLERSEWLSDAVASAK